MTAKPLDPRVLRILMDMQGRLQVLECSVERLVAQNGELRTLAQANNAKLDTLADDFVDDLMSRPLDLV